MRFWQHKLGLILALVLISTLTRVKTAHVYSAESTIQEKGLSFIRDVAEIDLTKYDVKIGDAFPGGFGSQAVLYTLDSPESKLSIVINLREDNAFIAFSISSLKGSPLFVQPKTTALEEAKRILEKYQTFTGASYLQELRNSLNAFSIVKNDTKMIGDIKMEMSVSEGKDLKFETIQWMKTVNGLTNNFAIVSLTFRNGLLERFNDCWNMYKIGSSDVNIDREKAISLAIDAAKKHSWTIGNITVSNVTIATIDNQYAALAELSMQPRADNMLYPMWHILLGLDKVYPGGITQIRVDLRADTGEIEGIAISGSGYGIPSDSEQSSEPSPSEQSSQSPSSPSPSTPPENSSNSTSIGIAVIASIVAVLLIAVAAVALKKRRK